ncbi:MAG: hypothetical protein HYX75_20210 [Acidobacteria bacterium]|nr:hypothetical protein [Acidobacteriota bacterium]
MDIDFGENPPTVDRESIVNVLVSTLNRAFENDFHFLSDQLGRWVRRASIKFLEFDSKRVARDEALCYSRVLCRIELVDPWRGAPIWVCLMSRLGEDPARWSDKWVGLKRDAGVFLTEIDLPVFIEQVHSIVKSSYPTLFGAEPSIVSDERITIVAVDRLAGANEWKLRIRHEADIEFWPSNPHTHVSRIDALISGDLTSHSTIRAGPERDDDSVAAKE